jgi:hypothetical protein
MSSVGMVQNLVFSVTGGAPIVEARWVRYPSVTEAEERSSVAGRSLSGKLRRSTRSHSVWPRGRTGTFGLKVVLTLASHTREHQFMDSATYGYSLLISAKACSRVAYTGSREWLSIASATGTSSWSSWYLLGAKRIS